jgi:hypothetical protein
VSDRRTGKHCENQIHYRVPCDSVGAGLREVTDVLFEGGHATVANRGAAPIECQEVVPSEETATAYVHIPAGGAREMPIVAGYEGAVACRFSLRSLQPALGEDLPWLTEWFGQSSAEVHVDADLYAFSSQSIQNYVAWLGGKTVLTRTKATSEWANLRRENAAALHNEPPKDPAIIVPPPGRAYVLKEVEWGRELETQAWVVLGLSYGIDRYFVAWAMKIYPGLSGHEDLIRSSEKFKKLVAFVQQHNYSDGYAATTIPACLVSKYDVVSRFIADVDGTIAAARH